MKKKRKKVAYVLCIYAYIQYRLTYTRPVNLSLLTMLYIYKNKFESMFLYCRFCCARVVENKSPYNFIEFYIQLSPCSRLILQMYIILIYQRAATTRGKAYIHVYIYRYRLSAVCNRIVAKRILSPIDMGNRTRPLFCEYKSFMPARRSNTTRARPLTHNCAAVMQHTIAVRSEIAFTF